MFNVSDEEAIYCEEKGENLTTFIELVWPSRYLVTDGHEPGVSYEESFVSFRTSSTATFLSLEPVATRLGSVLHQSTVLISSVCTLTAFYTGLTAPLPFVPPTLMSQNSTYRSTPTETNSEGESFLKHKSSMFPE